MPQEKNQASDKIRLRKNCRKNRNVKSSPYAAEAQNLIRKDISDANPKQRADYNALMKNGDFSDDFDTTVLSTSASGKNIIVDPSLEVKRRTVRKLETAIIAIVIIVFAAILYFTALTLFLNSTVGDKLLHTASPSSFVSGNNIYDFGKFPNFVTVGDTFEKAIDILGLPQRYDSGTYFYGSSYIIVENNIVTGFFKDKNDNFKVTIGYKESDDPIVRGDSARRVVKKLGSPDYCSNREWIYFSINKNFASSDRYSGSTGTLTLTFDENYLLDGYVFNEQSDDK